MGWDLRTSATFTNRLYIMTSNMAGSYNGDTCIILYQTSQKITEINMYCVITEKTSILLYFINPSNLFAPFFLANRIEKIQIMCLEINPTFH